MIARDLQSRPAPKDPNSGEKTDRAGRTSRPVLFLLLLVHLLFFSSFSPLLESHNLITDSRQKVREELPALPRLSRPARDNGPDRYPPVAVFGENLPRSNCFPYCSIFYKKIFSHQDLNRLEVREPPRSLQPRISLTETTAMVD